MATAAQIIANQSNAQHSTGLPAVASAKEGPRSDAGKSASAQNARTHGLLSKSIIVLPGQEDDFQTLSDSLRDQFDPEGALENLLFDNLLNAAWNQHRCRVAERELYIRSTDPALDPVLNQEAERQLKLIQTYGQRAERSFKGALSELRRVQTEMQYRLESDIDAEISPLVELKSVLPQLTAERLRSSQADLTAVRAVCEAPPPRRDNTPVPPAPPAPVTAAAPTEKPKQPEQQTKPIRGGFSRSTIFRRGNKK